MRVVAILFLILQAGVAAAQVRSVELRVPRSFGYFLGDLLQVRADIALEPGFTVQRASLPKPGPVTYWLDLRDVAVERVSGGARLRLTYQSFYAALDARRLDVPGFSVALADANPGGAITSQAEIPPWSFGVSPLREIQPEKRDDPADYLQPDGRVSRLDPEPAATAALVLVGLALLALGLLAYDRAWFGRRRGRPFARAAQRLRRLAGTDEGGYQEALRLIHRSLDETDGRRLLADDLPAFLDRHPAFREEEEALARFFAASRRAFFGREAQAAREIWPWPEMQAALRRLAAAERAA
ncbi:MULTISPECIES: nonribosomal peptide synthetase MxaA [unclassified Methylobacterium]|jgi:mxaA protein|uniref:nonribosomal peptide synthetase MxaA n=1 Tax=unclassified Methylobacterium TaxID=2615210 RepID=UPI00135351BB|nr:nonribosomal peptide synthetase MxaA [Methylobacterium sp. 2A]MWV22211.1 nonribosomal peptide synthetase MxaA [Methylobacterium sp. 2A]